MTNFFKLASNKNAENKVKLLGIYGQLVEEIDEKRIINELLHNQLGRLLHGDYLNFSSYFKEKASLPNLILETDLLRTEIINSKKELESKETDCNNTFLKEQEILVLYYETKLEELESDIIAKRALFEQEQLNYGAQHAQTEENLALEIDQLRTTLNKQIVDYKTQLKDDEEIGAVLANEMKSVSQQFNEYKTTIERKIKHLKNKLANKNSESNRTETSATINPQQSAERNVESRTTISSSCVNITKKPQPHVFRGSKSFRKRSFKAIDEESRLPIMGEEAKQPEICGEKKSKRKLFNPTDLSYMDDISQL